VDTAEQLNRLLPLEPEIIVSDTLHMTRSMVDAYHDAGPDPVAHAGAPR
jgi:hypothetical protein